MSAGKADEAFDWRRGIGYAALLKAILLAVTLATAWANSEVHEVRFRKLWVQWPPGKKPDALSVFTAYDSAHYLFIAKEGYSASPYSAAFYPLWPALIRAGVWLFGDSSSFQSLRGFKLGVGKRAVVFGVGLVLSRSRGLESPGSIAKLRSRVARQRQWLGSEHCKGKPAHVGVLSGVPFLSVSLQRVLVFLFIDGAHARASNRPSHSNLGMRMYVAVGAGTGSFLFSPFGLAVL